MSNRLPDLAFAGAAAALGIGILFVFRSMYLAEDILPFAQEMTLIFLGAVVTIILTAALLNRQTDLELRKEGRVIILQQQCDIYMACIEKVAEIVETARHDAKLIDELRVLSHKLAVVASAGVVSSFEQVLESLVIGQQWKGDVRVVLFVRLREGEVLDDPLRARICSEIRQNTTPRHVPAKVIQVADIPRTKSGKIVELAVRKIVHGEPVLNREALANPEALDFFANLPQLDN